MYAFCNGTILTGNEQLTGMAVLIHEDRIRSLLPIAALPDDIPRIDLAGGYLVPGFIDLQINGCGGVMFNTEPSLSTLSQMARTNLRCGTTSFLPTFITDSDEKIMQAIDAVRAAQQTFPHLVLGMHLEGPYTNVKRKGIHPAQYIRQPSDAMINVLCEAADAIKIITIAPEMNKAEHIQRWQAAGIRVSAGHSEATYEEAMSGFRSGIRMATHLYNAMSPTTNGRNPGLVGAVYDHPEVYAGIVCDGVHVHWANVRLAKKILGERLCLVTDAIAAACPPAGFTHFDFCGAEIFIENGRCVDANGTIGGSALTMDEGVRLLISQAGLPLDEAIRMATLYPARALGLDHQIGSIHSGAIANLTILNRDLKVQATYLNGVDTKAVSSS